MDIFKTIGRVLTLKITREEMLQFDWRHFLAGLAGTWLAGMGRYLDDPDASFLQHAGLGSVIYIFLLSFFIWLIVLPMRVEKWNYFTVLTYISLTSFPALLYAIPVERYFSIGTANSINVWFLGIIATWRLVLLYYFLLKFTRLDKRAIYVIALMPICLIISTLYFLNLHRVVFAIMGGVSEPNEHTSSYLVLMFLTYISVLMILPLIGLYIKDVVEINRARKKK